MGVASAKRAVVVEGAFVPVAVATLLPQRQLAFNLYSRRPDESGCVLYREKNIPLEAADLQKLLEREAHTLFIHFQDRDAYADYLREALVRNGNLAPMQRYQLLQAATESVFREAFKGGNVEHVLAEVQQISQQIVRCLCSEQAVLKQLFSLMVHDYCTYTHANNVSSYCVLIAWEQGLRSESELSAIAAGGLLLDIGKRHLPASLLNKARRWTQKESADIRRHPHLGFDDLCRSKEVSFGQLMMVYQHHERLDGSGYPVEIGGEEIDPWARICAVADVYDAMTAERSYQKGKSKAETLQYLEQHAGVLFDGEAVRCLKSLMSRS
jgi:HD-GYP domain-containing protein (c-di-GMP phosphodiesterase class II)